MLAVRRLSQSDARAYLALRRRSLDGLAHPLEPQVRRELDAGSTGMPALLADYAAQGSQVWAAADGDAMVGVAAVSREYLVGYGGVGVLWGVFVLPRYRGTPASRLLMEAIIDCCGMDFTLRELLAPCAQWNVSGKLFLQRFGFEPAEQTIGRAMGWNDAEDFLCFQRPLWRRSST